MTHEPSATFLEDLASTKSRPKTPPGPPHALSGDSPTKHPSVHSDQFRGNAAVEDKRDAIMKDVCAHQAGIDNFINALLPALHKDIKLERVLNALDQDSGLPWSGLEGRTQLNENDLYRSIGTFFCRIVELAKEMSKSEPPLQTFTYGSQPNTKPSVADRLTSNKPDGFIKLITDEDKLYKDWYSYALAAEYKLSSTKEKELNVDSPITAIQFDNIRKVLHSMQTIMSLDACRRFVFGWTMEGKYMTLWYLNRAMLVHSSKFNILDKEGKRRFATIVLSFAFAPKVEMGWDPTIQPICNDDGLRSYIFSMKDGISYTTQGTLQDYGADMLVGRGARVFKATKNGCNDQTPFALKDIWLEDGRLTEKEIYMKIIEDIIEVNKKESSPLTLNEIKNHFITPGDDHMVLIGEQEDHTKNLMMRQPLDLKHHIIDFTKPLDPNSQSKALPMLSDGGAPKVGGDTSRPTGTTVQAIIRQHVRAARIFAFLELYFWY